MVIEEDDAWWLPFWFDYPPEGLTAPWFNAMSQGLVLSFFVRLHRVTGDDIHLRAAEKVFDSYRRLGRKGSGQQRPWVAYVADGGYLWLEHYPNARPDHVLNAHHALADRALRVLAAHPLRGGAPVAGGRPDDHA